MRLIAETRCNSVFELASPKAPLAGRVEGRKGNRGGEEGAEGEEIELKGYEGW